jgi:CRP-like cAMP-binding protein
MDNFAFLVRALSQIIDLSADEKEVTRSLFREEKFEKGELFLRDGAVCDRLGFVCKGIFRYYIDQDGEDKTYNFAGEGDFICNYESLIKQLPSLKNIQAIEPSEVFVISKKDLDRFYAEVREGNRFGRVNIENVYAETICQLISHYTELPCDRYLKFLKNHSALRQRIPQYYIASYIGVKPQSLSRIRKRLASKILY